MKKLFTLIGALSFSLIGFVLVVAVCVSQGFGALLMMALSALMAISYIGLKAQERKSAQKKFPLKLELQEGNKTKTSIYIINESGGVVK